jgi:hypothetical protein
MAFILIEQRLEGRCLSGISAIVAGAPSQGIGIPPSATIAAMVTALMGAQQIAAANDGAVADQHFPDA